VLLGWQKSPNGAVGRVAILSRYLGHARVTDTYWYLSALPELMAQAAKAFTRYQRDET
jgi:integrase/recombinase XerD